MATLAELFVLFKGDDSHLDSSMEKSKGKLSGFAGNATKLIGGAVAGAAVAAGAAIVGIGTAAMNVSNDTAKAAADIAASLGLPLEEAEKFADVARRVYGNNFADSVTDAGDAVAQLAKQLKLTADDPALQTMTENAFRLRDVFGTEVSESVDAVKTLMENFGVSSEEAFDLLATGYQRGLDRSGDFLDTIGEYSVQFAEGGASAVEFFSALDSGLQGGMLGTDKAADAFKEFRLRIQDGSALTADSLEAIGLSAEEITAGLSSGALSTVDAWDMVQRALVETQDPVTQFNAGVGLLGSQFEDLGAKTILAMDITEDWAEGGLNSITTLDAKYATFGSAVEGVWRRLTVSVSPFTDKLLELVNSAMPSIMGAFDRFDATVGPAMENAGAIIENVVNAVKGFFAQFKTSVDTDGTGPLAYWKEWADSNLPRIQQLFDTVLGAISAFWAEWGDEIMFVVNNTFQDIWMVIDLAMRTIGDLVTAALQILTGDFAGAQTTLEGIVQRMWDTIVGLFQNKIDTIVTLFSSIDWNAVGEAVMNGIKGGMEAAWYLLKAWFEGELQRFRNLLPFSEPKDSRSPLRGLAKSGKALVENFASGMDEEFARLQTGFADGLSGLAGGSQPQVAGANATYNISVNINGGGGYEAGYAAGEGILDAMRFRGMGN